MRMKDNDRGAGVDLPWGAPFKTARFTAGDRLRSSDAFVDHRAQATVYGVTSLCQVMVTIADNRHR